MGFNCDQCDATYPVRKSLVNHKRLKHGDAKLFACNQCSYATTKKGNLELHVRSLHEKVKEVCGVCEKVLSNKSHINTHVRQFHSEIVHVTKTPEERKKLLNLWKLNPKGLKLNYYVVNVIKNSQNTRI